MDTVETDAIQKAIHQRRKSTSTVLTRLLKSLQENIGEHPEIGAAITKLELALNDLAIQTGGLL
jgi:hypothetical protein